MRSACSALICVAATIAALHAQDILGGSRDLNRRGEGVNRLERWVGFVQAHRAGLPDNGTRQLENWTADVLEELTIDLPSLLKLMDDPRGDEFIVWIEGGELRGAAERVLRLSDLRDEAATTGRDMTTAVQEFGAEFAEPAADAGRDAA